MPVWIDGGPRRRRLTRTLAMTALPVLAIGGAVALTAGPTVGHVNEVVNADGTVTFNGQGNGHGRGLGQWGAFGYAKSGWTAEQILAHFYGNSHLGKVDPNLPITVQLTKERAVAVLAPGGARVGTDTVAPGQAVRIDGRSDRRGQTPQSQIIWGGFDRWGVPLTLRGSGAGAKGGFRCIPLCGWPCGWWLRLGLYWRNSAIRLSSTIFLSRSIFSVTPRPVLTIRSRGGFTWP